MACAEWGRVKLNSEAAGKGNDEPDRVSELIGSDMTSLHIRRHVEHQWQSHTCQREQPHTLSQLSQPSQYLQALSIRHLLVTATEVPPQCLLNPTPPHQAICHAILPLHHRHTHLPMRTL